MVKGKKRERPVPGAVRFGGPELPILFVLFLLGAAVGAFCVFTGKPEEELSAYLLEYCAALGDGAVGISFFSAFWDCLRWPLLTALLGFTAVGVVGIPVLFAARGFLLSFAVCTFGSVLGQKGIVIAAVLFAVSVLFVLPVLFILGRHELRRAIRRLPNGAGFAGERRMEVMLVCGGILTVSSAVLWTVIPAVLASVCQRFLF